MAKIFITTVEVCNKDREVFPFDDTEDAYLIPFTPKTTAPSQSPPLYLKVTCRLEPATGSMQAKFVLLEKNMADFQLQGGTDNTISYFREVKDRDKVFLPFRLSGKKPIAICLLSRLLLTARDTIANSQSTEKTTRIRGI